MQLREGNGSGNEKEVRRKGEPQGTAVVNRASGLLEG
jgi:hypothetical protein